MDVSRLVPLVEARLGALPALIAVSGSVAAGKSTLAHALADALRARFTVEVVGTDGFLRPDEALQREGLLVRKGFPETYDAARMQAFFAALAGSTLEVPRYSHAERAVTQVDVLPMPQVVILEGVYALEAVARHGAQACTIYLDAALQHIEHWYLTRVLALRGPHVRERAMEVWRETNLANLRQNIEPWRERAEIVVHKGGDHQITQLFARTH